MGRKRNPKPPRADACRYCGVVSRHHPKDCPSVKAVEYYEDGSIKHVERKPK